MTSANERIARNSAVIQEFRINQGKVPSQPGTTLLLLGTTGAKSGLLRTNPVAYHVVDGTPYVFATNRGLPTNPDWYHNLVANPTVRVEVGAENYAATAEAIIGTERDRIYAVQAERRPRFAEYQRSTDRVIPVVALQRTD